MVKSATSRARVLRRALLAACALLVLIAASLLVAPVPIDPVAWRPSADAGYVGAFARNTRLAGLHTISLGGAVGPEHVAIGPDAKLYAAVNDGTILRMDPDGSALETWARSGGRVLGFTFDAHGRLIAADAIRGLLLIDPSGADANGRRVSVLADTVRTDGRDDPIRYANAVVIARDGRIYFTDSSRRFPPSRWGGTWNACVIDLLEHGTTGRVLVYDPATTKCEIVANGFSFANGLALADREDAVFVAETGQYRIWRLPVESRGLNVATTNGTAGADNGGARVVLANLPGFPDNLMRGMNGRIWVGLASPRSAPIDALATHPLLRRIAFHLRSLFGNPPSYGHVFAFDEAGRVVADLQDPAGSYPDTTGVTETAGRLYIQSVRAPALGWLANDRAGR